jgi:hypothetical protein
VVGYAMSRLGISYLAARGLPTWKAAFEEAGQSLAVNPNSVKNLRQEFDPFHTGRGWRNRPVRSSRQRVLGELCEVSDDALRELIARILARDQDATAPAIDALAAPSTPVVANVAERLLTGRRAEDYFLEHCARLVQVPRADLLDMRQAACGFDFGVKSDAARAIEVKGLKPLRGAIQFTDREWSEAKLRRQNYCVVVIGNLALEPVARVFHDPHDVLAVRCTYQTSVTAVWRSTVSVQEQVKSA